MNTSQGMESGSTPLARTSLKVVITDLLAEYELRHSFSNKGRSSIEAIYSFPVPLDAAFLGMEATLAGETLVAQVIAKQAASANYDDAIAGGDSAVLLERLEPGMLSVNLGNLKPGETGEIVLRFAATLGVADRQARFSLPLVHRPRYGRYRMEEWAVPEVDFAVEHPLTAEIRIRGMLVGRPVQCATQGVSFESDGKETTLRIPDAMLDRDLVVVFDLGDASLSGCRWVSDGNGSIAILTIAPGSSASMGMQRERGMDLCLVLDCSGSMSGDAISQSRAALHAVSRVLYPGDRVQVVRFGSHFERLFRRPLRASSQVSGAMTDLADLVQADMGGTQMGAALEAAVKDLNGLDGDASSKVILLVTDGAVQPEELQRARERATAKGIRIFVVAVGSSAGVDALTPLAESSGGVLERAVPTESIDACVMRHVRRAAQAQPIEFNVDWNGPVNASTPLGRVYEGDVAMTVAFLPDQASRTVDLFVTGACAENHHELSGIEADSAWRAWAGQQAYLNAKRGQRETIALRYQLITEMTSAVLVKCRAAGDKAVVLPTVVPVRHMVAEGMVVASSACRSMPMFQQPRKPAAARPAANSRDCEPASFDDCNFDDDWIQFEEDGRNALSRDEESRARAALRDALERVIFDRMNPGAVDLELVLAAVDAELRALVRRYVEGASLGITDLRNAVKLLQDLADSGTGAKLTDDQEARLSVFCQVASETTKRRRTR